MICDEMELIGKNMFAIDGCKMPSNASKEWSGTKEELLRKKQKMEKAVRKILNKHREADQSETDQQLLDDEKQYVRTLKKGINKIKTFLSENDEKIGKTGKAIKRPI